ncbi:MAG: NAD+ synthase [Thermoleophilaceae bacterium]
MSTLTVALAQMDPTVGDLDGNAEKIRAGIERARASGAQLVLFPELALTGYPPEDLLIKTSFLRAAGERLQELAESAEDVVALVGYPQLRDDVYNACAVLADGAVQAVYRKMFLPNYGVFDEQRYFQQGTEPALIEIDGIPVGVTVCEDIWQPGPPATSEAIAGAQVIANISASPYHAGKGRERELMLVQRARDNVAAVVFCNLVGGQDELVFDGHSVAIDQDGEVVARAPQFEEAFTVCTLDLAAVVTRRLQDARHRDAVHEERVRGGHPAATIARLAARPVRQPVAVGGDGPDGSPRGGDLGGPITPLKDDCDEIYSALVLGVRDYVEKNGFEHVVFGISGGIDSALVALIAVDALGPERVTCVVMPSPYSSDETQEDARTIASNLGCDLIDLRIEDPMRAFEGVLAETFSGSEADITEENLQARIRGNLVMALSNKFGWLVLTTGNKSEMSVGYATLYGDMAGGFAVLKDVFKGTVYRLVEWRNAQAGRDLVPRAVLDRPPSAELRYEQRDDESLPPYDVLDPILEGYVEQDLDADELIGRGLPEDDVRRVIRLVDLAEYKRRQAPPGVRISTKAFGRDRRLPITNRWRG